MILPTLGTVVGINARILHDDERFDEPDDLERIVAILEALAAIDDPVRCAGTATFWIARAQAFAEGNKRTAFLIGRWILDRNGCDGPRFMPSNDPLLADLLLQAARGLDVGDRVIQLFESRR